MKPAEPEIPAAPLRRQFLKTSALAGLPRVSTSQILSGASARADIELDGIEYPELPWLLHQIAEKAQSLIRKRGQLLLEKK